MMIDITQPIRRLALVAAARRMRHALLATLFWQLTCGIQQRNGKRKLTKCQQANLGCQGSRACVCSLLKFSRDQKANFFIACPDTHTHTHTCSAPDRPRQTINAVSLWGRILIRGNTHSRHVPNNLQHFKALYKFNDATRRKQAKGETEREEERDGDQQHFLALQFHAAISRNT